MRSAGTQLEESLTGEVARLRRDRLRLNQVPLSQQARARGVHVSHSTFVSWIV